MVAEINCPDEITTSTHIFLAVAATCFAWIFFCIPAMKLVSGSTWLILITLLIYCIIIPVMMISNGSIFSNLSGEQDFMLAKFLSVIAGIIIINGCLLYKYTDFPTPFLKMLPTWISNKLTLPSWVSKKLPSFEIFMSFMITLLLIVNIGEAGYVSFRAHVEKKQEQDQVTEFQEMNVILGAAAVGLIIALLPNLFGGKLMNYSTENGFLKLDSKYGIIFIIAYTIWNLAFRIQLIENTSVLLFFVVSLVLPFAAHILKVGDWMQIRAYTLLFLMIINMGLSYGEGSLFPGYNKTGYTNKDRDDILTKPMRNREFKIALAVLSILLTVFSLGESYAPYTSKHI